MTFPLEQIRLAEVDSQDQTFVVSFGFDLSRLQASVQTLGLLSPALVRRRQDGNYQIICGYQRFLVLEQLHRTEMPALVAPEETPAAWCLEAAFQDNVCGRGFNPMEAARMIEKLLQHFDPETVRRRYLPLLGLPPSRQQLQKAACLLALEAPWQELAARHRLTPEAAVLVSQWAGPDREAVLPWFQSLRLSYSNQLELFEYLTTLSRRAGNPPAQWLKRPELDNLWADPVLTPAEKTGRLWETLRRWCYPRASEAKEQFQHHLKALKLYQHPTIRLEPPPAFEDASFRLELRFQDRSQLARQLQQLQEVLEQQDFEALLDL
jgi:ParB family transcriptional regulator, chromosome partitioning protein